MKSLIELYNEHHGKSSDKWQIYLNTYHQVLSAERENVQNFLEIGVQNGGSLDIWNKYFPNAKNIIGCDINPDCLKLNYDNSKIKVVIGNSSTVDVMNEIRTLSADFDVIIDDGSHNSSDIIKSFLLYYPLLKEGGLYIIEDLHCSYWQEFEGGLYDPWSSMAFLKKLADVPSREHWGTELTAGEYLRPFYTHYESEHLDQVDYSSIHSVTFLNSLCIIKKNPSNENVLGRRHVVGEDETVVAGNKAVDGSLMSVPDQSENLWSHLPTHPEMEWQKLVLSERALFTKLTSETETLQQTQLDLEQAKQRLDSELIFYKSIEDVLKKELAQTQVALKSQQELANRLAYENHALLTSTSWRLTDPMRKGVTFSRKAKKAIIIALRILKTHGVEKTARKGYSVLRRDGVSGVIDRLRHMGQVQTVHHQIVTAKVLPALTLSAEDVLVPRILIIAEMSIPQCRKYRVDQKAELFKKLNIPVTVLDWTDMNACMNALQSHSAVIFYRVPAFESVHQIFNECDRLNLPTWWEVDDLIFDAEILKNSRTINELDADTVRGLLDGAHLYRSAMLRCKSGIASTVHLAEAMESCGIKQTVVVENALDPETIISAQSLTDTRKSESDGIVRIVYGSGTSTHNVDFEEASDAILNILKRNPNVHFRLIGVLKLPESFESVKSQIERIDFCAYTDYLKILNECDISIAPLEDYIFNNSKSNIKYIEASIIGLPSICSPRPTFAQVITHEVNGYLCSTTEEWEDAFQQLISSPELRRKIGQEAKLNVLHHYSPENIAVEQVSKILAGFGRLQSVSNKKQVLSVNCFYHPRSFGGATVVAEALNKRFYDNENIDLHVLTSLSEDYGPLNTLRRYEAFGQDCYGIVIPNILSENQQIINHDIDHAFKQALDLVKPDLVHFHSIQGLGITMLDICKQRNIKIVVTTHDYWWLYDHQFILSFDEKHKNRGIKNNIDSKIALESDSDYFQIKKRKALELADCIIAPSRFTTELYHLEGFGIASLNKNGVTFPTKLSDKKPARPLRFGYVGGNTDIKGFHLIKKVFSKLSAEDACLVIVDNTLNLGYRSFSDHDLSGFKNVEVIPAFTQANMDEFYDSIDVLLYPTQSKESFGLTVREALIRNVWVITSDAGGAAEDIIVGENGYVIPFNNNPDDLQGAVQQTLNWFANRNPSEITRLPHSHVRSFDEQYDELADIYLEMLK